MLINKRGVRGGKVLFVREFSSLFMQPRGAH
jgi:hypothetical protein